MKFRNWVTFSVLMGTVIAAVIGCSSKNPGSNQGNPANRDANNTQTATVAALVPPVTPKFDALAKNADGSLHVMTQSAAVEYCAGKNMHLPTIRELALLAGSEGAAGISPSMANQPDLTHVQVKEPTEDSFYFDASGYKPDTAPEVESEWLWSSSLTHESSGDYAYYFSVNMGVISEDIPSETHEVRCVI